MGNIISDIVDEIEVKPNKSKLLIKWIVSISASLITLAFVFGSFKASFFNRLDGLEEIVNENTQATAKMKEEMTIGFDAVNKRIDKVYDDGIKEFTQYQKFNNKKLEMIIDYGNSSKEMLKRMLEVTSMEETQAVQKNLQQAKKEMPELSIGVTKIIKQK